MSDLEYLDEEEFGEAQSKRAENELTEILLNTREQGQLVEKLINDQIKIKDEMINKLYDELSYTFLAISLTGTRSIRRSAFVYLMI